MCGVFSCFRHAWPARYPAGFLSACGIERDTHNSGHQSLCSERSRAHRFHFDTDCEHHASSTQTHNSSSPARWNQRSSSLSQPPHTPTEGTPCVWPLAGEYPLPTLFSLNCQIPVHFATKRRFELEFTQTRINMLLY